MQAWHRTRRLAAALVLGGPWCGLIAAPDPSTAADPAVDPPADLVADPGLHVTGSQGPLVVLQAGLGDDHRVWARLVTDLSRDHRVVTVDRPGRNGVPADGVASDPCSQAEQTRQRLQAAGLLPPYLLVGHSLGGRYAYAQARLHPQEAAGLVLVDATPPGHWQRLQEQAPAQALMVKALRRTLFDATTRREFDEQDRCLDELDPGPPPGVPAVVLHAGKRRPEDSADFAALMRRSQQLWLPLTGARAVETVAAAGHYIQREAPDVVAAAVRRLGR